MAVSRRVLGTVFSATACSRSCAFTRWAPRRRMAYGHPKRPPHDALPGDDADRIEATPPPAASAGRAALRWGWRAIHPGCGRVVDEHGDHALACPRTGLLARLAGVVERAWVHVAREAVGPEGQVVPQQWLAHTTAPGVPPGNRRRLKLVIYGATPLGGALCCDATLVSPLARDGTPTAEPQTMTGPCTAERRKRATYPELAQGGAQQLCVLGCEVGDAEAASVV